MLQREYEEAQEKQRMLDWLAERAAKRHANRKRIERRNEDLLGKFEFYSFLATAFLCACLLTSAPTAQSEQTEEGGIPRTTTTLPPDQQEFTGFDCSKPINRESVVPEGSPDCDQSIDAPKEVKNVTMLVLQRVNYVRQPAKRCSIRRTVISSYCGSYSHVTLIPQLSFFDVPQDVSPEDCEKMFEHKGYRAKDGQWKKLEIGAKNIRNYEQSGKTWFSSTDVSCEGGNVWYAGQLRQQIMRMVQDVVTLEDIEISVDEEDEVISSTDQIVLGCRYPERKCVSGKTAYVWEQLSQKERCPYFLSRKVTGQNVVAPDGTTAFISTDGSMIRLLHQGLAADCGQQIIRTNYKKIFLTEAIDEAQFLRRIHHLEMSVITYSNVKADYTYHVSTAWVTGQFNQLVSQECKNGRDEQHIDFAAAAASQAAADDGITVSLGRGYFATAAAETWIRYQCRELKVRAVPTNLCFNGLLVDLMPDDKRRYLADQSHHHQKYRAPFYRVLLSELPWPLENLTPTM